MGEGQDRPIGDARKQAALLAEVIGEQHGLAVPGHQRVHHTKQHRRAHCRENGPGTALSHVPEPVRHALMEPALKRHHLVHLGGVACAIARGKPRAVDALDVSGSAKA
jgi:hypothetical protein